MWILDTNKEEHRKGRIQLIDGTAAWHPMGKGMGDKRREMTEADRDVILDAYRRFEDSDISKIVTADDLGYRDVPVYRIRRLTINITDDTVTQALTHKDATPDHEPLIRGLDGAWNDLPITIRTAAKRHGARVSTGLVDAIMDAVAADDPDAPPAVDRRGRPVLVDGSKLTERIPLSEDVTEHMQHDVLPFAPDATWDENAAKIGYEIPFTRLFYKPTPLRSLEETDADVVAVMRSLGEKFKAVHGE
ncbi:SAM-dependent DNA methyltransferase [Tessaracoccus sp. SD287]|uniref:SAM-dependent DNA methyltransferase n=1 Tax=Tessaracoccus sp. SD287 TaxID=2782008 RepID=UPI001A964D6C|nr:SAM-dependent DNA methyltransferase [Tessaracoccus sp. SD287]MBO1031322.1 SAM-dependent DNA methyltransferase [Tessaracoccus sp. SD287]